MANVIASFFVGFGGDAGQVLVRRPLELLQQQHTPGVEQKLSDDRAGVIAVRQLDQLDVAILDRVAEVSERILIPPLPFDLAGETEKIRCLADEIERDVGKRDVLFEHRPVPAPLG